MIISSQRHNHSEIIKTPCLIFLIVQGLETVQTLLEQLPGSVQIASRPVYISQPVEREGNAGLVFLCPAASDVLLPGGFCIIWIALRQRESSHSVECYVAQRQANDLSLVQRLVQ